MSRHFNKICEFGELHGTCRCPSDNKAVIKVPCDRPGEHKPVKNKPWSDIIEEWSEDIVDSQKPLRERLEVTVDAFFGNIIMSAVKVSLLDKLEQDVKDWLFDNSKNI